LTKIVTPLDAKEGYGLLASAGESAEVNGTPTAENVVTIMLMITIYLMSFLRIRDPP
jgi:hypothetical protein